MFSPETLWAELYTENMFTTICWLTISIEVSIFLQLQSTLTNVSTYTPGAWPEKITVGIIGLSTDENLLMAVMLDTVEELKQDGTFPDNLTVK